MVDAVRDWRKEKCASAKDISALVRIPLQKYLQAVVLLIKVEISFLVLDSKKVSDLNNEIATAIQEQASGIQQINTAMSQLDQSVQTNAALCRANRNSI